MTDIEAAWIAGLFDGEGYVGVTTYGASKNGRRYRRLQVSISNTHRPTLERVRELVGFGHVCLHGRRLDRRHHKPCFAYKVQNRTAIPLLHRLLPFLVTKHERVVAILSGPIGGPVL